MRRAQVYAVNSVVAVLSWCVVQAPAQASRQVAHVDSAGAWIETEVGAPDTSLAPERDQPERHFVERAGIVWSTNYPRAIVNKVAAADLMNETWLALNTNDQDLSYLQTDGDVTPVWDYPVTGNPSNVVVASAEVVSLAVVGVMRGTTLTLYAFSGSSSIPIWTYPFTDGYDVLQWYALDVSADGQIVVAAASKDWGPDSRVVILNGATGGELVRTQRPISIEAAELCADGSRVVLSESNWVRIYETAGLTLLYEFQAWGGGGIHRISRDGKIVIGAGFDVRVVKDNGSGWHRIYMYGESGMWYGDGAAFSGDGNTLLWVANDYATYQQTVWGVIDLVTGTELGRKTTQGTGTWQDFPARSQGSYDGRVFASATWGTQNNVHPEVQVFDRQANVIGSIDTPGSPFDLDLTADGHFVVVGCKHVHANVTGMGGDAYVYAVPPQALPGDLNCDGTVNFGDINPFVLALTGQAPYEAAFPNCRWLNGDVNGDGHVNFADINPFVALLSGNP